MMNDELIDHQAKAHPDKTIQYDTKFRSTKKFVAL